MLQLVSEPTKRGAMLDLLFANRDGLVGDVMVGSHLGYSDYEITEFLIFGEIRRNISKTFTLDFWRADFGLFRRLIQSSLGRKQRSPGKVAMLQNRDLEGTGTDCPCVPKDESTRQTSSLDGKQCFEGT